MTGTTQIWTDCHCHILPNLDDGAKDLCESLAIAAILTEFGFSKVHCTPHSISGAYEASPVRVRQATLELQEALDKAGIPLRVFAGSEYYCDEFLPSRLHDPLPLGSTNMILMEAPLQTTPSLLSSLASQVVRRGFTPLIAHPERCALLQPAEMSKSAKQSIFGSVLRFANARIRARGTGSNLEPRTPNPTLAHCSGQWAAVSRGILAASPASTANGLKKPQSKISRTVSTTASAAMPTPRADWQIGCSEDCGKWRTRWGRTGWQYFWRGRKLWRPVANVKS